MDLTEAFLPDKPVRGVLFHCVLFLKCDAPFCSVLCCRTASQRVLSLHYIVQARIERRLDSGGIVRSVVVKCKKSMPLFS